MRVLSLVALAAPFVSAIQFSTPVANSTLSKGQTYSVKWSSVDTDPASFSIFLVNFVNWPPFYTQVASNVATEDGEREVTVPCDVDSSWGFQFNAINGTNVYVIHAQTSKFSIRDGDCSGASPPVDPTCQPVTVTETAIEAVTSTVTLAPSCPVDTTSVETSAPTTTDSSSSSGPQPTDTPDNGHCSDSDSDSDSECDNGSGEQPGSDSGSDSDSDSDSDSEQATATATTADHPTVTAPPSIDLGSGADGEDVTTSTIYSTVYVDLSEVEACVA